ncbi:MAG: 5'/3'-nucleotidase SurE [Candidatus Eisenbacteria bacterium]|nr:5'/3'-nucleotidase SurE [Candidatus Eisenbacteria bacterium]
MRILVTNDDGIRAAGLQALKEALHDLGDVWVVAPDREQSAASHALTLSSPLRLHRHSEREFSVDGTPTDCVLLAVKGIPGLLEPEPEIVVSGINHGPNLGDDVTYSGTVAAALEGRLLGRASLALSLVAWSPEHFDAAAQVARDIVGRIMETGLPDRTLLNVNIPDLPAREIKGLRVTHLGNRVYRDTIIQKTDPRGKPYYWIGGDAPDWEHDEKSDFYAVQEGYVSLTPITLARTDFKAMKEMESWDLGLTLGDDDSAARHEANR